ncbi:MAG: hypothetical protein ABIV93_08410 [Byssovorax sp.]
MNKMNLSVGTSLRSLAILLPAALLFGMTGCIAEADADEADEMDQVEEVDEEPLSDQQEAALQAGVALKDVTYRITDDVSTNLVTADRPGRTMDAAGNATMSWVYGRSNVVGVCDNLVGKIGLKNEHELFGGGVCLKVAGHSAVYRVVDALEDGQACGDPSRQHLDVHRKAYDGLNNFVKGHKDANLRLVDCGTEVSDSRVIFQDWDPSSDRTKVVHFYGLPAPVTSVSLNVNGKVLGGHRESGGRFRFESSSASILGSHKLTLKLRHANGSQETASLTVAFPSASQIHQFQVTGNDVQRKGKLSLLEIHQGESMKTALDRAEDRKDCIKYLTAHPSATSANAKVYGHCAP